MSLDRGRSTTGGKEDSNANRRSARLHSPRRNWAAQTANAVHILQVNGNMSECNTIGEPTKAETILESVCEEPSGPTVQALAGLVFEEAWDHATRPNGGSARPCYHPVNWTLE